MSRISLETHRCDHHAANRAVRRTRNDVRSLGILDLEYLTGKNTFLTQERTFMT